MCGNRHRKDYGDLDGLARSIDEIGILHPIVITPNNVLIAGERRMRAWPNTKFRDDPIPVHVVDIAEIARGEAAENGVCKDFTPSEAVAISRALESELKASARERQAPAQTCGEIPRMLTPVGRQTKRQGWLVWIAARSIRPRRSWTPRKLNRKNTPGWSRTWIGPAG
jgi:hypothetical protein